MKKHPVLTIFLILAGMVFFSFVFVVAVSLLRGEGAFLTEPVVVTEIDGPIVESLPILKELKGLEDNRAVKAVVLRINSPGGPAAPAEEIYEQVLSLKQKKKVVVSMGTVAASGGYYIAVAADKIVASGGTITGSIGVIMESFGLQRVTEKLLLEPRTIKSGTYKDAGNPFRDMTESERLYFQGLIDDTYEQFKTAVSVNRHIPMEEMDQVAEGRVFTGLQAKNLRLVDEIGNVYRAIAVAKELAGLPESVGVRWPREPTFFEEFFDKKRGRVQLSVEDFFTGILKKIPLWLLPFDWETS